MTIWILNHYAIPRHGSGITTHAVLADHLQRAGHTVTVFPATNTHAHQTDVELAGHQRFQDRLEQGVRFRYVRTRPFGSVAGRFLNMLSYRANVLRSTEGLKKPDVVVGTCVHPFAVDAALRLARRYEAAFVYEIRDIWPESLLDLGVLSRRHPVYWYLRRLELRAFRRAAGVLGVFPGIGRYAQTHGVPPERVCYVPNGIDRVLYPQADRPAAAEPFVLSYFGKHALANGLTTVLDAAARLQRHPRPANVLIRLVGDGTHKPALRRQAAALGLRNVEFLDPVPKTQLAALAQQTHAFVYSLHHLSVVERYGLSANKLFDYLMAARPVIFSCKALNNPVAEARAGITVPGEDPVALAEAVVALQGMPSGERERMGRRGREYVLKHHDLATIAGRLEDFLQRVTTITARGQRLREAA